MFRIRIHGRGGQGVVTAAELLSVAAFSEDRHAQAFPSFGSERMGAPVTSFCRIDDREIRSREPILVPDAVIVSDPTLLHSENVFEGLSPDGYVLINSSKEPAALGIDDLMDRLPSGHVCSVPATEIALRTIGRPIPSTALLGAFAALTGVLRLDTVHTAIAGRFKGPVAEKNAEAASAAYDAVQAGYRSLAHAEAD